MPSPEDRAPEELQGAIAYLTGASRWDNPYRSNGRRRRRGDVRVDLWDRGWDTAWLEANATEQS